MTQSSPPKILVTGGAGYIGSSVVRQLGEAGYSIVVYDNCSTGFPSSILYGQLVIGDLADTERLHQVFHEHEILAVMHFAGSLIVPESLIHPLNYYANNTSNTLSLIRCCQIFGVNRLIFSSTAAVYGNSSSNPISEAEIPCPINPYGRSKLASEWIIQDYAKSSALQYVILRYFNVAGADPEGRLGQMSKTTTHLVRSVCDAILNLKPSLDIFGTDFPTRDGTAVRDYIHVEDLAKAHLDALRYLENGGESQILNCGYGQGYSVREVVDRAKAISGVDFLVRETERRLGDPASVIACADSIRQVLNWTPKYNNLDIILRTALAWEIKRNNLNNRDRKSVV